MRYIAHAAVKLQDGILDEQKNKWVHIKNSDHIEYRWRVCGDRFCEIIAGLLMINLMLCVVLKRCK